MTTKTLIIGRYCVVSIVLIATIDFLSLSAEWSIQHANIHSMFSLSSAH